MTLLHSNTADPGVTAATQHLQHRTWPGSWVVRISKLTTNATVHAEHLQAGSKLRLHFSDQRSMKTKVTWSQGSLGSLQTLQVYQQW